MTVRSSLPHTKENRFHVKSIAPGTNSTLDVNLVALARTFPKLYGATVATVTTFWRVVWCWGPPPWF